MTVRLCAGAETVKSVSFDRVVVIGDPRAQLAEVRNAPEIGAALEAAFDDISGDWLEIARSLADQPTAGIAHTLTAAANLSDFGLMLAWSRMIGAWALEPDPTLVICDDPWMFRHLRSMPGVDAERPPPLWPTAVRLWLRGLLARACAGSRFAALALALRPQKRRVPRGAATLLVYGHPWSDATGCDGYFGIAMQRMPDLHRVLHIDAGYDRVRRIAADRKTTSLHAWGNPLYAIGLIIVRWRPVARARQGPNHWLVRRAAAREGGTAQPAAIAWQAHCQARWIAAARPAVVAWPWENHAWERALVAKARASGVPTVGYQHSVVGRQMLNYSPRSTMAGEQALPDRIVCTGSATRDRLAAFGVPPERMTIGGALRFGNSRAPAHNPASPVYLALPFEGRIAAEMVSAARRAAKDGWCFLIRDHPMTPFAFIEDEALTRADGPLERQSAVAAVVYAATTVGLQAILAGLPTLRFRSTWTVAMDVLPSGIEVPTVTADTLSEALRTLMPPPKVVADAVFAPADWTLWQTVLQAT